VNWAVSGLNQIETVRMGGWRGEESQASQFEEAVWKVTASLRSTGQSETRAE
jgi:hypothetical protein